MKRFVTLALVLAFALAMAGTASAAELKAKGSAQINARWADNWDFVGTEDLNNRASEDDFQVNERSRITFDFIANENLKAVLQTEIGTEQWGDGAFQYGTSAAGIEVRQLYVTFNWPDTDVNITGGYFTVALPWAVSGAGPILNEQAAALAITSPIYEDKVSVLAAYSRPYDTLVGDEADGAGGHGLNDEVDLFALALPVTLDGVSFTPFGMYGHGGLDIAGQYGIDGELEGVTPNLDYTAVAATGAGLKMEDNFNMWWGGLAFDLTMFDPIVFQADFVYGSSDTKSNLGAGFDNSEIMDRAGWFADAKIAYTGLDMMQPYIIFGYGSGDDDDVENGSERLPVLKNGSSWGWGSFYYAYGSSMTGTDRSSNEQDPGQWTIALGAESITFVDKLTHDFWIGYIGGTNDEDLITDNALVTPAQSAVNYGGYGYYLTTKDHLIEVDFNTQYQIYEELLAILELGYINVHMDEDVWGIDNDGQDAWKCALGLLYNF